MIKDGGCPLLLSMRIDWWMVLQPAWKVLLNWQEVLLIKHLSSLLELCLDMKISLERLSRWQVRFQLRFSNLGSCHESSRCVAGGGGGGGGADGNPSECCCCSSSSSSGE
jgi:hypothetical protein